jgi:polyisoprenoid-binding protein YceI
MRTIFSAMFLSALVACTEDVGKDKVAATVEEPKAEAPAAAPAAPAANLTKLTVNAAESKINALGAKITAKHPIVFKQFTGSVELNGELPASIAFEAQMGSLEADHPKLTEHLKEADFFDIAQFPTATFTSTEIKAGSDVAGQTHTVTGNLQIRGKSKTVTFPANFEVTPAGVKATTEFVINRQDFGVTYPGKPDDLIQDNVVMTIALVAPRA